MSRLMSVTLHRWFSQIQRDRLLTSSSYFAANTLAVTGLGVLFWWSAARLYPAEGIGLAVVAISTTQLITTAAQIGFGYAVIRFLPEAGSQASGLINSILTLIGALALSLAGLAVVVGSRLSPEIALLTQLNGYAITFILMTVALATITFAILSTRPKVTSGTFSREDIMNRKANLLFFGNFHKMDITDFEAGMKEITKNIEIIHDTLIRDIYYLGRVLGKRFEYLRISYNLFMFGLIATLGIFVVLYLFH